MSSNRLTAVSAARPLALIADDDPIFRSLVASRLSRMGCAVFEAEDGTSAWRSARAHSFDLAIVDFEMPGLNGINLVGCLRGHPRTQHMPILMCTSRTDVIAMQEALEAGLTSFLTKPVNWNLFDAHISHLLHLGGAASMAVERIGQLQAAIADVLRVLDMPGTDAAKIAALRLAAEDLRAAEGRGRQAGTSAGSTAM